MEIVYKKPMVGNSTIKVMGVAATLYQSNRSAFILEKIDPFNYLKRLKLYGVDAKAIAIKKQGILIGYKFLRNDKRRN